MNNLEWTGNPIVDTGLSVILLRSKKEKLKYLSIEEFKQTIGDGKWILDANIKLNAYSSLFTNGFLNKTKPAAIQDGSEGEKYLKIIKLLKDNIDPSTDSKTNVDNICECTGTFPAVNSILRKNKIAVGRNAFPLLGSAGNDAGMFPSASREPLISAFALICAQVASMAAVVMRGKIVFFQYTEPDLLPVQIKNIYNETVNIIESSRNTDKIKAIGTGEGTKPLTNILLNYFLEYNKIIQAPYLSENISLNLWLIQNGGQKCDCDIIEMPNTALQFLFKAAKYFTSEIKDLVNYESKKKYEQILECITKKTDYSLLYPGKKPPVSKGLFMLYQIEVLNRDKLSILTAEWIANLLVKAFQNDKKILKEVKTHLGDYKDVKKTRLAIKKQFIKMAEEGNLSYEEYLNLFPISMIKPLRIESYGWKFIWFFLNQPELSDERPQMGKDYKMNYTEFKLLIKDFAKDLFLFYTNKYGRDKFSKKILNKFKNKEVTTNDLQEWFCRLAESTGKDTYNIDTWDELCRDENGINKTYEIRFQLWLELSNIFHNTSIIKE